MSPVLAKEVIPHGMAYVTIPGSVVIHGGVRESELVAPGIVPLIGWNVQWLKPDLEDKKWPLLNCTIRIFSKTEYRSICHELARRDC